MTIGISTKTKRHRKNSESDRRLDWQAPLRTSYIDEPLLAFGDGGFHIDPKAGIARHGPHSLGTQRHPSQIRCGLVGTARTIERSRSWLEEASIGVEGDERHPRFPGFQWDRGFFSQMVFDDSWISQITQSELDGCLDLKSRERFLAATELLDHKVRILSQLDNPPDYIVVALDQGLRSAAGSYSYHARGQRFSKSLRRSMKAMTMKYRIPTQIMTARVFDKTDEDHPSKIAWNFFTGAYFKAGGVPWAPVGIEPGTCYLGISFYRKPETPGHVHASLVQAFDEHGNGLVLRGPDFEWDSRRDGSKSPHLSEAAAAEITEVALARYKAEMSQSPMRVVVYKSSRFWEAETAGFKEALGRSVARFDLVALQPQNAVRLFPESRYPTLRGTAFTIGDLDFLYTTGYLGDLQEYHGVHLPAPIQIADHIGQDTERGKLLAEILLLTKLNWNTSRMGGLLPIPLRFSRLVGDILREIEPSREPLPQLKYYV